MCCNKEGHFDLLSFKEDIIMSIRVLTPLNTTEKNYTGEELNTALVLFSKKPNDKMGLRKARALVKHHLYNGVYKAVYNFQINIGGKLVDISI
jgi:hypothetical protein